MVNLHPAGSFYAGSEAVPVNSLTTLPCRWMGFYRTFGAGFAHFPIVAFAFVIFTIFLTGHRHLSLYIKYMGISSFKAGSVCAAVAAAVCMLAST